jgi:succinoglycan biosynthesis transport protein ExoP
MDAIADANHVPDPVPLPRVVRASEEVDVVGVVRRLWRLKSVIVVLTLILASLAAIMILSLKPRYEASAEIIVDDRRAQDVALPDVIPAHLITDDLVLSEAQVLSSRDLSNAVVDRLGLAADPEFNAALRSPSLVERWEQKIRAVFDRLTWWKAPTAAPRQEDEQARIVDTFLRKLSVAPVGRSRVIKISFESESPQTAALVANTLAKLYLERQIQSKVDAARHATDWIETHIAELRDQAVNARIAKEQYRNAAGLLTPEKDITLTAQQLGVINQQLVAAQAREQQGEAQLALAKKTGASIGFVDSIPDVVNSRQIQALRQQEATVQQRVEDLEAEFGARYPQVEEAEAQLHAIRSAIHSEMNRIGQSLENDLTNQRSAVTQLTASLNSLKDKLSQENLASEKLAALDEQLTANDSVYKLFLDRAKQTALEATDQKPDAEIVSRAGVPQQPIFPRTLPLLTLAVLTSGFVAASASLIFDQRKAGFISVDQVQAALGKKPLGILPIVKSLNLSSCAEGMPLHGSLEKGFAEAIRGLHVRLMMMSPDRPKTIMFASSLPGEGKTIASLALAALVAETGRRVLIIDCDSRQPNMHRAFGLARSPGLMEHLLGLNVDEVIVRQAVQNIDVIPAGEPVMHPGDLLDSTRMHSLLAEMSVIYDLVILDSPPVIAVSDALVLGPIVDRTVFVIRWDKTPQVAAERGLRQLVEVGTEVAGTILTMVNMEKLAAQDPSARYYGQISRYYRGT